MSAVFRGGGGGYSRALARRGSSRVLLVIINSSFLNKMSFCLQILHFAVHLSADLSIANSLKTNSIILG